MSLMTKYRPSSFSDVIGQDAVVHALEAAIKEQRAKAFLFSGPSGTGKTTLARIAAEQLGCLAVDLEEVDAASKTGIEDMRAVTAGLMFRPLGEGNIKAIIIDESHALSKQAITSLLKILEEPPPWVYWFLCTTEPTKIPKAIQTRCLHFQLKAVRTNDLIDLLERTEEAKEVEQEIVALCAEEAKGSPRQALANLGVCLVAKNVEEAAELLESADERKEAFELARLLVQGGGWAEALDLLSKLGEASPESVRHVVRDYVTKVVLNAKSSKSAESALAILEAFSQPFPASDGISPLVLACGKLILGG